MADTELKPCPFCGADADGVGWNTDDLSFRVHCSGCNAKGEYCDTSAEAIAAWNRRALTPTPVPDAEGHKRGVEAEPRGYIFEMYYAGSDRWSGAHVQRTH